MSGIALSDARRADTGSVVVEFALLFPVLVLLLLFMFDVGRFFFVANYVSLASQETTRVLALGQTTQVQPLAETILTSARRFASVGPNPAGLVVVTAPCTSTNRYAKVTLRVSFNWVTPANKVGSVLPSTVSATGQRLCPT